MISKVIYSVIIPVFEEGDHLESSIHVIQEQLLITQSSYEIVLIDDGSTDSTWSIIQHLSSQHKAIRALRFSRNFGKEYAICAGLEAAKGSATIIMDADLQHPPDLIQEMIKIWNNGSVDIVEAVKVKRASESLFNKLFAYLFYIILESLSGQKLKGASDYKLLDRKVVDAWLEFGERSLFFRGMVAWLGFKKIQIPFEVKERFSGVSKWSLSKLFRLALTGITSFSSIPLYFVTLFGILFFIFAVILAIQTLIVKITGNAVSGFTTVIILLLMTGSLIMISLGIIGEYIARIYEEVKKRPRYIIRERIR